MPARIEECVAQVLPPGRPGEPATGAGFLVASHTLVTCAHVIQDACPGVPLGQCQVLLRFPYADGGERTAAGRVIGALSRPERDVAFLAVEGDTDGISPAPLGARAGAGRQRPMRAFGFPAARDDGRWADGHIVALAGRPGGGRYDQPLIQLESNALTVGFSGGPVLDLTADRVIGMVMAIESADQYSRGQSVAWALPASTLSELNPELRAGSANPYRGLLPFTEADTEQFQGRDDAIAEVLRPLRAARRLVILLGPSGSGKSSIMRAGVLPALADENWHALLVARPGEDLPRALEAAGLAGTRENGLVAAVRNYREARRLSGRLLLLVDQFEELLAAQVAAVMTHPALTATRQIMDLCDSAEDAAVVLVVRDDFYSRLAEVTPDLLDAAASGLVNVPARLDRAALSAIIAPPGARGMPFDRGLVDRIIRDMTSLDENERLPAAPAKMLPALELTLTRLWEQAEADGNGMTHDAYEKMHGVVGGFVSWGDLALRGLTGPQREAAGRILASLVRPADEQRGIPATKIRRTRGQLREIGTAHGEPAETADRTLDALIRHRVLIAERPLHDSGGASGDDAYIGLVHDSLIQQWGQLADWVARERRFTAWLDRAEAGYQSWARSGQHDDDLLTGTALTDGLHWQEQRNLSRPLSAYLARSQLHHTAAERRRTAARRAIASLAAVVIVVAGFAVMGLKSASDLGAQATSVQKAATSGGLLATDPVQAARLAVQAYRASPTEQARKSLEAVADQPVRRILRYGSGPVEAMAFSLDGRNEYLATGEGGGLVIVWNTRTGQATPLKLPSSGDVESVAFSKGGDLAAAFENGDVAVWSAPYTRRPSIIPPPQSTGCPDPHPVAWSVAYGKSGPLAGDLAVAYSNCNVLLYGADRTLDVFQPGTRSNGICRPQPDYAVAISGDGGHLAVGAGDDVFVYTSAVAGAQPAGCPDGFVSLTAHRQPVTSISFSSDSSLVASVSSTRGPGGGENQDRTVLVQKADGTGQATPLNEDNSPLDDVVFAPYPGSTELVTAEDWGRMRLWNAKGAQVEGVFGGSGAVYSVAYGDHIAASGGPRGTTFLWSLEHDQSVPGAPSSALVAPGCRQPSSCEVQDAALSPDGTWIADVQEGQAQLWKTGHISPSLVSPQPPSCKGGDASVAASSVAFSPAGELLAVADSAGGVMVEPLRHQSSVTMFCPRGIGSIGAMSFSRDGRLLALAGDQDVQVWALRGDRHTLLANIRLPGAQWWSVALTPDGKTLAAGGTDGTVRAWNLAGPRPPSAGDGSVIATFGAAVRALAFSPDGTRLAAGSWDETVRIWNASTLRLDHEFTVSNSPVTGLAFSSDGNLLATVSDDGQARLWNAGTGDPLMGISVVTGGHAEAVSIDRSGTLMAAGDGGTVGLWKFAAPDSDALSPQNLIRQVDDRFLSGG